MQEATSTQVDSTISKSAESMSVLSFNHKVPLSGLDFTEIPLEQMVETFRYLGRELLLGTIIERQRPDLATILVKEDARILAPDVDWTTMPARYLTYGRKAMLEDLRLMLRMNFRELRKNLWRTRQQDFEIWWPPRATHAFLLNRLERSMGKISTYDIPDDILDVVAENAWGDLGFQHEMASLLQAHLRQNELFIPGDKALIALSPKTFWTLLALIPIPPALSRRFFGRDYRTLSRAIKRLRREAEKHIVDTAGWAGFWDQWVIWTAMDNYPDAIVDLTPALYNAIIALPIFRFTDERNRGSWLDDKLSEVEGMSTSNEQGEDPEPIASTVNWTGKPVPRLADPAWIQEMPGWFQLKYSLAATRENNHEVNEEPSSLQRKSLFSSISSWFK